MLHTCHLICFLTYTPRAAYLQSSCSKIAYSMYTPCMPVYCACMFAGSWPALLNAMFFLVLYAYSLSPYSMSDYSTVCVLIL